MVGYDEVEVVSFAIFKLTGWRIVNCNNWLRNIGLECHHKLKGVFVFNLGRLYVPRISDSLVLHKGIHSGDTASHHAHVAGELGMAVGCNLHAVVAFRQVFGAEMPVLVGVALSNGNKRIIACDGDVGTCKMWAKAVVSVPSVFVGGIHKYCSCRFRYGGDIVRQSLIVTTLAVQHQRAGIRHQCDVLCRRQTQ